MTASISSLDPMPFLPFDIYPSLRPLLFRLDPEQAHLLALAALKWGLAPSAKIPSNPILHTKFCGFDFAHPLGLAAGFDKQAEIIDACFSLGFSFVELGGVTPVPQPGNPRPRLFRAASSEAIINRFGFNSVGADLFLQRLTAWKKTQKNTAKKFVGINLAKNKDTADAADDYVKGVATFAPHADFLTVNISSPNTPGLRDMQGREALTELLQRVGAARAQSGYRPLLFLKIAPDLTETQMQDITDVVLQAQIDGMIVSNTTLSRPSSLPSDFAQQTGGLSGKPLFEISTRVLGQMYQLTDGKIPLIGVGGISTGANAYAKIRAGASLLQLYSVLVYRGPLALARILSELVLLLERDGFSSVADAVGADFKK